MNFLSFLFYQSTALSSRAVDGHQMYSEGSVVCFNNWYRDRVRSVVTVSDNRQVTFSFNA